MRKGPALSDTANISSIQKSRKASSQHFTARLNAVLDRFVPERILGCVVLVTRFGETVYESARGYADIATARPVHCETLFRYASLTKLVLSTAFFAMMDRGQIGLDDPVAKILPDFRPRTTDGRYPPLTFRHLLSHSSGLSYGFLQGVDGPYRLAGVSDGMDQPGLTASENLRRLAGLPLFFEPGTAWQYSLGSDVVGAAMEVAALKSLDNIVRELIAEPLGLTSIRFYASESDQLATPYFNDRDGPRPMSDEQAVHYDAGDVLFTPRRCYDCLSYPSGGSGIVGTAKDFSKLLEVLRTGGHPILSETSAITLAADATGAIPTSALEPGWRFTLGGFALLIDPVADATYSSAGTWRWGGVYGNHWFVDPRKSLSVVVLTNTTPAGMTGPFAEAIREALYLGEFE
ncbi:serine hydrolase domain-containing protein [Rhizobium acidisoli]|nr:serine hydrolase domain-containing protein [Rhizobium acidisoli]